MPKLVIVTDDNVDMVAKIAYTIKTFAPEATIVIKDTNLYIKELNEECAIATE